ncbi:MAG TPA: serine protease [Planctomycetota bacterium]|nr:serine protease [Planctomycetota bacterium]
MNSLSAPLRRTATRALLALCFVLSAPFAAAEGRTAIAAGGACLVDSTVRIKVETETGNSIVSGYGSAFGVDLSPYGITAPRYLLSAAHLVLSDDGHRLLNGRIKVELPRNGRKVWAHCHVLTVTRFYDLCLLECDEDLPVVSKLACAKPGLHIGERIAVVGCPLGVQPQVSSGYLSNKDPLVSDRGHRVWEASAAFNHGNSGGPVFNADQGTLIGVAVAGVRATGGGPQDMDPSVALFTPYYCVKHFLDVSLEKIAK